MQLKNMKECKNHNSFNFLSDKHDKMVEHDKCLHSRLPDEFVTISHENNLDLNVKCLSVFKDIPGVQVKSLPQLLLPDIILTKYQTFKDLFFSFFLDC